MSERDPKILILGQTGIPDTACVDWFEDPIPNLADYDIVFLNEMTLGDKLRDLGKQPDIDVVRPMAKWLEQVKDGLAKLVASNGRVYAILDPSNQVTVSFFNTRFRERIPFFLEVSEWCPFPVERMKQAGDTIRITNDDFRPYLEQAVDSWTLTLNIKSEDLNFDDDLLAKHLDSTKGKRQLYDIAVNRQEQAIAAAFGYTQVRKNEGSDGRGGWKYGTEFSTGVVVLLPGPTKMAGGEALLLLRRTVEEKIGYPLHRSWDSYEIEKSLKALPSAHFIQSHVAPEPATPAPTTSAADLEAIRLYKRWSRLLDAASGYQQRWTLYSICRQRPGHLYGHS